MDLDLKRMLIDKLNEIAPEYGLVELQYPSFMRCYGYRTQPLSAADAVEGISALLDVAEGVRMEIEAEGARNGGEWFGRGKTWEGNKQMVKKRRDEDHSQRSADGNAATEGADDVQEEHWWIRNFWTAYDAVNKLVFNNMHRFLTHLL
jgi:cell division control protein 45